MIISFSGPSGSGKSTIIAEIKHKAFFSGKTVIIREEDSFLVIKSFKYLLGNDLFSKYKEEKYFKKRYSDIPYKLFSILTYITYPIAVYIEFLAQYVKYEVVFKDTILIIDKFIYDHAVNFKNILEVDERWVEWLYNYFPKPYLSFLININLTNAYLKRNKNNIPGKVTSERLLHQNILTHYSKIAEKQNLIVVDNNGDLKDSVKKVYDHIVNKNKLLNARRIAICGLDGSGKTTTADMLAKYATSLNIKCKIVHFVHNNLLYRLLLALGYYNMDEPKNILYKRSRAHSARERIHKTPFIMAFLRFFDSYIQYLYYILTNRNKLIIFDRFFYDYLVSFEYLNIKWSFLFKRFVPTVKNKFLFKVSPEVSYRRKPERVKAFFTQCHKLYLKVAKEQNLKIIATDKKQQDQVLKELINNLE